jgi:putative flippase GtrA
MKNNQIVRFVVIGIINTVFYFILYILFIFFKLDYKLAVLFATILGIVFSFKTLGSFVFKNKDNSLFIHFLLLYSVLYFVNITLINFFNDFVHDYYIAGFFATMINAVLSFILNKFLVFKS